MSELSSSVMDHASDPRNRGALKDADAIGRASLNGSPPFITIYLKLADQLVSCVRFEAQGCGYTVACCSVLTEMVSGQPVSQAARLAASDILRELDHVPPHRRLCATLAVEALEDALRRLPGKFRYERGMTK